MHPENKEFLIACINSCTMSVSTQDGVVMYHTMMPDGRILEICAEIFLQDTKSASIYYTISLGDELLEDVMVDTSKKIINPIARDIIDLMRMCSTKIMMQEAHLVHSRFMVHEITNKKSYS